jgi:bifunctional DNA-binding transcriptional regulator/antitoxin component of YhaV-PrlF toxin-antitoxin module
MKYHPNTGTIDDTGSVPIPREVREHAEIRVGDSVYFATKPGYVGLQKQGARLRVLPEDLADDLGYFCGPSNGTTPTEFDRLIGLIVNQQPFIEQYDVLRFVRRLITAWGASDAMKRDARTVAVCDDCREICALLGWTERDALPDTFRDDAEVPWGAECADMARAIVHMMTMANFSGFITQDAATLKQFENAEVDEQTNHATLTFKFGKERYIADIFLDARYHERSKS